MRSACLAEWILARVTAPDRAVAITGDLAEQTSARGNFWFWFNVFRTVVSLFLYDPHVSEEIRLGLVFGLVIGGMWQGLFVLGNLGRTSVLGNISDKYPAINGLLGWFAIGALASIALAGLVAGYRTGSIRAALRVGVGSGFISGAISLVVIMSITVLFHDAMMLDPSNIHEFSRSAHRPPTQAELSHFLYWDALGGGLNMLWVGPLLGVTIGAVGAFFGKAMVRADQTQSVNLG